MSQSKITVLDCPSGDWQVLLLDGIEFHSSHSIPDFVWVGLLRKFTDVQVRTISDEDMQNGDYNVPE